MADPAFPQFEPGPKGANALVMFKMNAKETERCDGTAQDPKEAKYTILPLDGFAEEVHKSRRPPTICPAQQRRSSGVSMRSVTR